jgi:glycosyltransferase involved in cell wall biosynthesis
LKNNLPQILMAHLGSRLHYSVPVALQKAGMLGCFFTDSYVGRGSSWHLPGKLASLIPESWRPNQLRRLLTHEDDNLPANKIKAFNLFGLHYALTLRRCRNLAEIEMAWLDLGNQFCELIIKNFPKNQLNGVMIFGNPCWPLFQKAQQMGLKKIMEKGNAILVDRQIVHEEHELWPDWEAPFTEPHIWQPRLEQEQKEVQAADLILCPSHFGIKALKSLGVAEEKIQVVPYGMDVAAYACQRQPYEGDRPLRVLYVGKVALRKGVQYLFEALQHLDSSAVKARMVGSVSLYESTRNRLAESVELTGLVPATRVRGHYEWADVFVFPSISEGSAAVIYEALAAGLPVITTPNAGSWVRDGVDGYLVPIRNVAALAEKIDLLSRNPDLVAQLSRNARERAQEFSWDKFAEKLTAAIMTIFP